ncbi:hypothetical protein HF521_021287 [Silurus meridionalis]|uniref:Uncharacterized protein n=1 Tax=Silurus meridionalis TaxID=175797 RepID=A0A8T0BB05_SILME|nr:hypothetical protein HF521_021287 [Silurus meridionalis]
MTQLEVALALLSMRALIGPRTSLSEGEKRSGTPEDTVLCLHKRIEEFIYISPYFPTRGVRGFTRSGRTSHHCQPLYTNQHDQTAEDPAT